MASKIVCPICYKKVSDFMNKIKCSLCLKHFHKNCTMFRDDEFRTLSETQIEYWSCRLCNESIFAFNHIDENELFQRCLIELNLDNPSLAIAHNRNNLNFINKTQLKINPKIFS